VGKPPRSPYPPDLADDAVPAVEVGDLVDAVVDRVDAANQRSPRLRALRVEFRGCRLTGAELAEASLTDVTFVDCQLDLVGLRFAKLRRVAFHDCRMRECDLYQASLTDVLFEGCELRDATFSAAAVDSVELRRCDLSGLRGVEGLRTARMPWNDVIANVGLFAGALGIEIVD
jgi:uncharacterized protein YjbI with pentapeptide repeats